MSKIFLKEIKNVSVGNLIITGSIFNNYCGCKKKCSKKPVDELKTNDKTNNKPSPNDKEKDKDPNNNHLPNDKDKDDDQNEKPLSKEDLEKKADEVNKNKDELEKIIDEIKKKQEDLNNLKVTDISAKFNSIKDKEFFNKCKNLLDIVKDSDYLGTKKEICLGLSTQFDKLSKIHEKLSTDADYYNKYLEIVKIYAYYFSFLKELNDLKSKLDEKVKKTEEDKRKLDESVIDKELDITLKKINKNLSYKPFISGDSFDKILNDTKQKLTENNSKIEKIKNDLTAALTTAKEKLETKKNNIENDINNIQTEISKINKDIEDENEKIKSFIGGSNKGTDVNYKKINDELTKIFIIPSPTNGIYYIDCYNDYNTILDRFKEEKNKEIKRLTDYIENNKRWKNDAQNEINKNAGKKEFDFNYYHEEVEKCNKKISEYELKINNLNKLKDEEIINNINKANIPKGSRVIFNVFNCKLDILKFDKDGTDTYDLGQVDKILDNLTNLYADIRIYFLDFCYDAKSVFFDFSPKKNEGESDKNYEKRKKIIEQKVEKYFEVCNAVDYSGLNKGKKFFTNDIKNLKNNSKSALKEIEEFFKKTDNNEYGVFKKENENYIKILEGLGTQYFELMNFKTEKLNEIAATNKINQDEINKIQTIIIEKQSDLNKKKRELSSKQETINRVNNSLNNLDNCLKNIITEDEITGEKNVNEHFHFIYYNTMNKSYDFDLNNYTILRDYNSNIAIEKSLNGNKGEIEKAVTERNEKLKNIKELKDKYDKIISKCKSAELKKSDIEKTFKNIVEELNNGIDYDFKMYFEDIILCNVKSIIECNEKGGECNMFCDNGKKCFDDLKKFVENSNLKVFYDDIIKKCENIIKDDYNGFPYFLRHI